MTPTRIVVNRSGDVINKGDRVEIVGRERVWSFTLFRRWRFSFGFQRLHKVTGLTSTTLTIR